MVKKDIYQQITNQIISDLEKGALVWEKPWEGGFGGMPKNVFSKSFYSGINTVILVCGMREKSGPKLRCDVHHFFKLHRAFIV